MDEEKYDVPVVYISQTRGTRKMKKFIVWLKNLELKRLEMFVFTNFIAYKSLSIRSTAHKRSRSACTVGDK
jgi:hypothetical protein